MTFKGRMDAENGAPVQFDLTIGDMLFEAGADVVLTNNVSNPTVSFKRVESSSRATYNRNMVVSGKCLAFNVSADTRHWAGVGGSGSGDFNVPGSWQQCVERV